jgi:hypothetical protein
MPNLHLLAVLGKRTKSLPQSKHLLLNRKVELGGHKIVYASPISEILHISQRPEPQFSEKLINVAQPKRLGRGPLQSSIEHRCEILIRIDRY